MPFDDLKPLVQPEMVGLPQDGTGKSMGPCGIFRCVNAMDFGGGCFPICGNVHVTSCLDLDEA